jgi:tetratricopeptide (TPR) repeat protein
MSHLGQEAMRRILAGDGGAQEAENASEHLVSCGRCRAQAETLIDELRAAYPDLRAEGPLKLVFDLIDRERQWGVDSLAAVAEWDEVRNLSRRGQRDRVRMSKVCHTIAFFNLVLDAIKEAFSAEEAEFLTSLALLTVEAMSQRNLTPVSKSDLQAKVWVAIANARRKAAEWKRTHDALANAERYWKEGTRDRCLEASLLSITASTLADEGQVSKALEALERCVAIYESLCEGPLVGRTLVKLANILAGTEPAKGLVVLNRAAPLIPTDDPYLVLLAELLRVECLIEVGKPKEALHVFRGCSSLLTATPKARMRIRGKFTGARLMDALGHRQQAERLFNEVVDRDVEHELYKDAFLDLLYLYERHVKAGNLEKAARACRRALTDPTLSEVAHDQMRDLWTQLLEAAQREAISQDLLKELRQYFSIHWKHPAAIPPSVAFR